MNAETRQSLEQCLARAYTFTVTADPDGGYVVVFPDLPGCMTQVETLDELPHMAEDARRGWIETAYEAGMEIPTPSYPEEYSGKFVLRLPRSLHRQLAEAAEREGVSLNQYAVALLARGHAEAFTDHLFAHVLEVLRSLASMYGTDPPAARGEAQAVVCELLDRYGEKPSLLTPEYWTDTPFKRRTSQASERPAAKKRTRP